MSVPDSARDAETPLRLLSLDGGGIRGLSTLMVLRQLMIAINPNNPPKPCEYFHLIGGTSTGGLIAIMLGRLQMDVDECITKYINLSKKVFQPKRKKFELISKMLDLWTVKGSYDSEALEAEFKNEAHNREGDENALLESESSCKIFVCAYTTGLNGKRQLRSYTTKSAVNPLAQITIWQAARATSAAATFFDPIKIGNIKFVDGATGMNNPVQVVLDEAKSIWPNALSRIQCILSIGTGKLDLKGFGNNLPKLVGTLKAIATETNRTEAQFFSIHSDLGLAGRYFRFNVDQGLGDVRLDEHDKAGIIEEATIMYLEGGRVQEEVQVFASTRPPQDILMNDRELETFLNWLPHSHQLPYYNNARNSRTQGTGQWFLKGDFSQSIRQQKSFIWLCAKPGSGKTVLSSAIIDKIQQERLGTLAYFYFSFQAMENQDLQLFKTTILSQIVRGLVQRRVSPSRERGNRVPRSFYKLHKEYASSPYPPREALEQTFHDILKESQQTFVVVDALDECPGNDQAQIITFLSKIYDAVPHSLHIIITSRRHVDIEMHFKSSSLGRSLRVIPFESAQINSDIKLHVEKRMEEPPFRFWKKELKNKTINYLNQRAEGVFRWADLQLYELRGLGHGPTEHALDCALQELPPDLEKTYERILMGKNRKFAYQQEAIAILRFLAYARRPIRLSEAAQISGFVIDENKEPGCINSAVSFKIERTLYRSMIRHVLLGLVIVSGIDESRELKDNELDNVDSIVSFAHFSVKEYLSSDICPEPHVLRNRQCQLFILQCCLEYIRYYDAQPSRNSTPSVYPLLLYVCTHWPYHLESLMKMDRDIVRRVSDSLIGTLDGPAFITSTRVALHNLRRKEHDGKPNISHELQNQLHMIAGGSIEIEFPDINIDLEQTTSLWIASTKGYLAMSQILLDGGMYVDEVADERSCDITTSGTALHFAASNGHLELVRLLLLSGANVNAVGYRKISRRTPRGNSRGNYNAGWTPLHSSVAAKNLEISQVLIDHGADVNAEFVSFFSVIRGSSESDMASAAGYPQAARLLHVEPDNTMDEFRSTGITPLHLAARVGDIDMIRLLLKRGAVKGRVGLVSDIRRPNSFSTGKPSLNSYSVYSPESMLLTASKQANEKAIRVLLDDGTIPPEDAVYTAAAAGNEKIVLQLLRAYEIQLEKNADPITQGWRHSFASDMNNNTILALKRRSSYGNALLIASAGGHSQLVRELLRIIAADKDLEAYYDESLNAAAFGGHQQIVEMLLEKFTGEVNYQRAIYASAICYAKEAGHERIIELLRSRGNLLPSRRVGL
ncbi:hypothetical protein F5Y10DRAFT_289506 [Nemania abortiva]|nr:hypothetical protein F5Y10DRAFT_289506 [Nemania abortiva]